MGRKRDHAFFLPPHPGLGHLSACKPTVSPWAAFLTPLRGSLDLHPMPPPLHFTAHSQFHPRGLQSSSLRATFAICPPPRRAARRRNAASSPRPLATPAARAARR